MAGRLFAQLGEWSMLDDAALAKRVAEIGAPALDADGLRSARRSLFAQALETPGGLKILTIHSFCQQVLARFPLEAGVPPSFRVLDDQTAHDLGNDARARAGTRRPRQPAPRGRRRGNRHPRRRNEAGSHSRPALGSDRRKFERYLDRHGRDRDAVSAAVRSSHGIGAGDTYDTIAAAFCAEMRAEETRLREIAAWLSNGKKTDAEHAAALTTRAIRKRRFRRTSAACS